MQFVSNNGVRGNKSDVLTPSPETVKSMIWKKMSKFPLLSGESPPPPLYTLLMFLAKYFVLPLRKRSYCYNPDE